MRSSREERLASGAGGLLPRLFLGLSLAMPLSLAGCAGGADDPRVAARRFVETGLALRAQQFQPLREELMRQLCAASRQRIEDAAAAARGVKGAKGITAADLFVGAALPAGEDVTELVLVERDGARALARVTLEDPQDEARSVDIPLVLEGGSWLVCPGPKA